MADLRLQRLTQVLARYSLGLKHGDRLAIQSGPIATPLIREVGREALRAGAHPETFISSPGVQEILFKEGSDEQLTSIPPSLRMLIQGYEIQLQLHSEDNTKALSSIDPARMALSQQVTRE